MDIKDILVELDRLKKIVQTHGFKIFDIPENDQEMSKWVFSIDANLQIALGVIDNEWCIARANDRFMSGDQQFSKTRQACWTSVMNINMRTLMDNLHKRRGGFQKVIRIPIGDENSLIDTLNTCLSGAKL